MTTFDQATARTTVDDLLHRLRTGAPITTTERTGLADLLLLIKTGRDVGSRPEHDSPAARSGLWRNLVAAYETEFGGRYQHGQDVVWRNDGNELPVTVIQHHDDGYVEIHDPGSDVGWTVPEGELSLR